ncbi:hypothetical protein Dimus_025568 [Dionaea muscipula]
MKEMKNSSPPQMTTVSAASGEVSTVSSSGNQIPAEEPLSQQPKKKQRNQPGMPDPEAEVVALSPKTLLATNRFVCEICGKGFQRDQNLQLHRRGHNLPWKLRQRTTPKDQVRKRVYVCPEASCIHHDPRRALGDLTGIKKHFCRKHGEKKWKCERCSKRYAVQSDWKAHMKTCGTKEYKCDCGTIFSRRDSFVTHRAFCDALAQESATVQSFRGAAPAMVLPDQQRNEGNGGGGSGFPAGEGMVLSPVLSIQSSEMAAELPENTPNDLHSNGDGNGVYGSMFAPVVLSPQSPQHGTTSFSDLLMASATSSGQNQATFTACSLPDPTMVNEPTSLSLSFYPFSHAFAGTSAIIPSQQPALSATALLQKAAQMGSTTSSSSLLGGFSNIASPLPNQLQGSAAVQWNGALGAVPVKVENGGSAEDGLRLGLPSDHPVLFGVSGPGPGPPPMVDTNPGLLFGSRPTTLDLLGLGIAPGNASPSDLSAFLSSMDQGLDVMAPWDIGLPDRKPNRTVP